MNRKNHLHSLLPNISRQGQTELPAHAITMPVSPWPGGSVMSDTMRRFSRPPTGRRPGGRRREPRELIFSTLHPAFQSLRDKNNILCADESLCEEHKKIVKNYDAQLKRLFNPRHPCETLAITILRNERAETLEKIKASKCGRSKLIMEHSQAEQVWQAVNMPSDEEYEILWDRLDQEFKTYWQSLKADTDSTKSKKSSESTDHLGLMNRFGVDENPAKGEAAGVGDQIKAAGNNTSSVQVTERELESITPSQSKAPSIRSLDITCQAPREMPSQVFSSEGSSTATEQPDQARSRVSSLPRPPTPAVIRHERRKSPVVIASLENFATRVNGSMRTGRIHVNHVLRSIGNLGQRRRKSD